MFNWKGIKEKFKINNQEVKKDKYYDLAVSNSNWRRISFSLVLLIFVLIFGLIKTSEKNKIQTFVVEKAGIGEYSILGKVEDVTKNAIAARSDEEIIYFLKNYIERTKSITPSIDTYKKNYATVRSYMTSNTAKKMENYLMEGGYKDYFQNYKTVEILYNTGIRLDKDTFQLRWNQRVYSKDGNIESVTPMIGVFTVTFAPVESKEILRENPLGLLITDYREQKEIIKN